MPRQARTGWRDDQTDRRRRDQHKIAKTVFEEMYGTGKDAETVVKEQGLVQVSDTGAIETIIDEVIKANPGQHADYKAGKDKLFGVLRGPGDEGEQGQGEPEGAE